MAKENSTGEVCAPGLLLPMIDKGGWNPGARGVIYFIGLLYSFIGVSVVTDIFMGAVVNITSKTRKVYLAKSRNRKQNGPYNAVGGNIEVRDQPEVVEVRVWNDTVANLTLMALGTSAPEILLACIEIVGHNFESGELGPGTIVGSAAFNLLIITAICLVSVPSGESRRIRQFRVFVVCSLFSIFAYIWLMIVLLFVSPHVVELWEAIATFLMFPGLVLFAYATDKDWCRLKNFRKSKLKRQLELGAMRTEESEKMIIERQFFKDGKLNQENLIAFVKEMRKYSGLSHEDAALLAASKIADAEPHSTLHYRIGAVRGLTGSRKLRPRLSVRLQEVYDTINQHPHVPDIGEVPELLTETHAIIEFNAATCAVIENIGTFKVTIWRHGNVEREAKVRVETVDGSAKANEDYIPIDQVIVFASGECEKQIEVTIVDDNKWEPDEEFFLKLSLVKSDENLVQLGRISIMEITIIDDDKPGVISFEKRGYLVKESAEAAVLRIVRKFGADGDITMRWRTIDDTALSGRDYAGGSGEIVFKHGEVVKLLEIPIIDDSKAEVNECFEVELFDPTNGARLGIINRTCVTITNDDMFANTVEKLMLLTNMNIDAIAVCRKTWAAQMKDAMNVNGGDLENATTADYVLHFLSFGWKVLFSLIPPASILGGWLCFFVSLFGIGLVTALIGDIASTFGCIVGIRDAITAITLVAMGTSLPDTIASRTAAIRETYADTSVGNITGSNSVNVFLGLGLPWLIASIYHSSQDSVFRVPAGTLGFSVLLFSISAIIAFCLLILRRKASAFGAAELGGPLALKYFSGSILILLWVLYIVASCLQEYGYINVNF
ncbi:UNVERIFIED_CONTAM: hypothetical protein PYX00_003196 [Menopon gallinae]|uniref:Calx-beta domain-containing protein n=1 Tax=Menopon gallinae TaxID=328185 RepID=A0AAW2HZY9_9NEOP